MKSFQQVFEDKRITVMGLGVLGRGIADVRFLHSMGAKLTVTDIKTKEQLAVALEQLKDLEGITYVLGEHRFEDFEECDYVLKAAGVPLDSPYIARAKERGIPVKMDESWTAELSPDNVTFIGVTGTRGKSTTALMIYHALVEVNASVHLGGNVPGAAMLPLLSQINEGDIVVMELSSWQLQGWYDAGMSPHISIFTSFMDDHLNYYPDLVTYFNDKAAIFSHQNEEDILIISPEVEQSIEQYYQGDIESAVVVADASDVPNDWSLPIPGLHNRNLAGLALRALEVLELPESAIRHGLESFVGVPGRLEYLGTCKGAPVYNDNNATTPQATKVGLEAIGDKNNVVLIMGGTDKGIDFKELYPIVASRVQEVFLLDESGSHKILEPLKETGVSVTVCDSLSSCIEEAVGSLNAESVLLFSPAFASFGKFFKNEYDRGEQFLSEIKPFLDSGNNT